MRASSHWIESMNRGPDLLSQLRKSSGALFLGQATTLNWRDLVQRYNAQTIEGATNNPCEPAGGFTQAWIERNDCRRFRIECGREVEGVEGAHGHCERSTSNSSE